MSQPKSIRMSRSVTSTLLSTIEIMESVLFALPMRDLLLAQRVCKQWQQLITQSPQLQRKLFLRPSPSSEAEPEFNDLLMEVFPPLFRFDAFENRFQLARFSDLKKLLWFQDEARRDSVLNPIASWRYMFPVQPPAKLDKIIQRTHAMGGDSESSGELASDLQEDQSDGVRMGLLYDVLFGFLMKDSARAGANELFIRWHMVPIEENVKHFNTLMLQNVQAEYGGADIENKITVYAWRTVSCVQGGVDEPSGLVVKGGKYSNRVLVEFQPCKVHVLHPSYLY